MIEKSIYKLIILCGLLIGISGNPASAQIQLSGRVFDSTNRNLVEGVQILCTCGTMSFTDTLGRYNIFVGENDSVFFFFRNKPTQRFPVAAIKNPESFDISLLIYVPGKYQYLEEVIVYGKNRRLDSIENRLQYEKIFQFSGGGLKISPAPVESGIGAGLDLESLINLFRFRYNRSQNNFRERLIREEQDRYIDYRFNSGIVKKLTSLKDGPLLDSFLIRYRPDYLLLTQALDIELYQYIQAAAKEFLKER
jgi:hypothetical protein